jgi:hypothetical protein
MRLFKDATDQELEDYAAGKLKLVTNRSGVTRMEPVLRQHPNDKGITSQDKRAYYRVWYMKNRHRRRAYARAYKARQQAKKKTPAEPASHELDQRVRDRNYMRGWRKRNKQYCKEYAHKKYMLRRYGCIKKLNWFQKLISRIING